MKDSQRKAGIIGEILRRSHVTDMKEFPGRLSEALGILQTEPEARRPHDRTGSPGGCVKLDPDIPTLIVPDLHARIEFMHSVLLAPVPVDGDNSDIVLDRLEAGSIQIVCVGDAFHGEGRAMARWKEAYDEYVKSFRRHKAMDEEMRESLGLLEIIALCKTWFPSRFHFLKGNHENVANEGKEGNYPFGKFVREGEMVREWCLKFLGQELFDTIYRYEKALPLMAVGNRFLVTHAEPAKFHPWDRIVNCYLHPEVIYDLTWTDNGHAEENSVRDTLEQFFPGDAHARIFGGHRPVQGLFSLRADRRYVQINNPNMFVAAFVDSIERFDPMKSVFVVDDIARP